MDLNFHCHNQLVLSAEALSLVHPFLTYCCLSLGLCRRWFSVLVSVLVFHVGWFKTKFWATQCEAPPSGDLRWLLQRPSFPTLPAYPAANDDPMTIISCTHAFGPQ